MPIKKSYLTLLFWLSLAGAGAALVVLAGMFLYLSPKLPPVEQLRQVQLQTPLRVYSSDGKLIGEFGEQRRTPVDFDQLPDLYIKALLSAEDAEFYDHPGVSIRGLLRAASQLLKTGEIQSGGSTLTMQLARDFFLSRDQVFSRKFNEILLALQIENELTKEDILELFSNKMYFGNRAYGIQAAAQIYYGKDIDQLELHQWAMIVGTLKAPSAYNPLANLERAVIRRNWILGRMHELGHIDQSTYKQAINTPDNASYHGATQDLYAPYVAELARREAVDRFGQGAYNDGYRVYTTINSRYQAAGQRAVVDGLLTYDWRHGYRGPERQLSGDPEEDREQWQQILEDTPTFGGLEPAAVVAIEEQAATVVRANGETVTLGWDQGLSSARAYISPNARGPEPQSADELFEPGDVIRLYRGDGQWLLRQLPQAQAALVSLDPDNGALRALVGGFDFRHSNFNRALQAERQPGSSFKPFVYTAALEHGFTPATLVNDSPIVIQDASLEGAWRPENDGGTFLGPTRLREALYRSRNLVSIRVLRNIGLPALLSTLEQFGFEREELPRNLSLALGSHSLTPVEMARGFAVFANGGYRIEPHLVDRIENIEDEVVHRVRSATVCRDCELDSDEAETPPEDESVSPITDHYAREDAHERTAGEMDEQEGPAQQLTPDEPARLKLLEEADTALEPPPIAPRVLDERTTFIMDSMLRDVISRGTGHRARVLERSDLAGKTGTTNGPRDAWFAGYNPDIVTVAWLGFDQQTSLGRSEYGGTAALPIWINYMREALKDFPERAPVRPEGIVSVKIDPENGKRARPGDPDAIFEIFRADKVPPMDDSGNGRSVSEEGLPEELF